MPNHVINRIRFSGEPESIMALLTAIQDDDLGIGSIDFEKIIPMPESLRIEAGSSTERGLKAYLGFVEVCTLGGTKTDVDLLNIPEEKEQVFLKMRPDIGMDDWNLGRQAFRNVLQYGAKTWYAEAIRSFALPVYGIANR